MLSSSSKLSSSVILVDVDKSSTFQNRLIPWNHYFDLILLVINVFVLNISIVYYLGRYLFRKLIKFDCIKNKINLHKDDDNERGLNVTFDNNSNKIRVEHNFVTSNLNQESQFSDHGSSENSSSSSSSSDDDDSENYSISEDQPKIKQRRAILNIITQIIYLLLSLFYLAYLFELFILHISIRNRFLLNYPQGKHQFSIEMVAIVFVIIVHLFQYGFWYRQYLWFDHCIFAVCPTRTCSRKNSKISNNISDEFDKISINVGCYHQIILHSIALVYFMLNIICYSTKLILTGVLFKNHTELFFRLLRPYIILMIIIFQLYFTVKHWVKLIHISKQLNSNRPPISPNIKYRRKKSTFLSMLTFAWFLPILKLGYRKNLDLKDLGTMPKEEQATVQFDRFVQHYKSVDIRKYKRTFLWRVCWRTYRKSLICGAIIKIFSDLSSLIGPISIGYILDYISDAQEVHNCTTTTKFNNNSTSIINVQEWKAIFVINEEMKQSNLNYLAASEFFSNAYVMTVMVLLFTFLQSTLSNNFNHLVISEGIHLKSALSCCIYRKALNMPISGTNDAGVISNFMAIDTLNIFQFFTMMHYLWAVPIKISILLYLLYQQMGISAILGASIFFILAPFQYLCSRQISNIQKLQLNKSDKRISKTTELFMGIKLLKLMGWEFSFAEQVKKFRKLELDYLGRDAIFVAINTFITQASAIMGTMVTFCIYTYIEKKTLKASTVFTSIALFNQITVPLYIVPLVIPMLISAIVSHRRLVNYLSISELRTDTIKYDQGPIKKSDINAPNSAPILLETSHRKLERCFSTSSPFRPSNSVVEFEEFCCFVKNGKFAWNLEENSSDECILYDINLSIPRGKLTILVGSMGCGKSTLLASLIGETFRKEGELHWLNDNEICFGYVPSRPWILSVTVQENITFGKDFDQKRYQEVIKACCLQTDIGLLPKGNQTVIGERGITLSGGQRQRIALARALYSSAKTLILDDSLSNLDPIVGYSVFENAIIKLAIKNQKRTVILATHKDEYLSRSDYVIFMECGTIKNEGTLQQLEKQDKVFLYHRFVIKQKELRERFEQKFETCKTTQERKRLLRLCSKQAEFRGPYKKEKQRRVCNQIQNKCLRRQASCDIPDFILPYREFEDNDNESLLETNPTLGIKKNIHKKEKKIARRVKSNPLDNKKALLSIKNHVIIEEEFIDSPNDENLCQSPCEVYTYPEDYNESVSDVSEIHDIHDEEFHRLMDSNENQLETEVLYNTNMDPTKNTIKLDVYLSYIKAHGYQRAIIVFILIITNQLFRVVSDFWLADWTDKDEHRIQKTDQNKSINTYILAYVLLSIISVMISLVTNIFAQLIAIKAVRRLHNNLLETMIRCPLRFFDKTPIGRIINCFTNDINVIDKKLPIAIPVLFRFLFLCLSVIIVNIIICPYFVLAIVPILIIYYYLQKIFRCTSRQLQRLESTSKSPIISHFNQTFDGLTTIRAFNEEKMFTKKFYEYLDCNNLCFLMVNSCNCFLGIVLDYFGGIILFIAMMISITAALYWNVHSAYVGLAMTYTLLVPVYLNWLVRNLSQVEMDLNSVERIYKYSQLEVEDSWSTTLKKYKTEIPEDWLKNGDIQFKNVTIRYGPNLEPVIFDANIHISPGEKIGICGRTGSGKSTLIGALFRINQILKGKILIDGFDISHICPYKLRKQLSIIPQDLVLFTGSIRDNLDPYREHSDEDLWKLLKDFRLDKTIFTLDEIIGDESSQSIDQRFSSGERQLLCCARAFLRNSPILFMDESTSLLDKKSEDIVLDQILKSNKTIIAIAHRISNIVRFDRVIVVDKGRLVEFDAPETLLNNEKSLFYSLYHKYSY